MAGPTINTKIKLDGEAEYKQAVKEINAVTGYIRGGCTAIGMKKQYPTVIDQSAGEFDRIIISGGRIGTSITVNPDSLLTVVRGQYADVIRHE